MGRAAVAASTPHITRGIVLFSAGPNKSQSASTHRPLLRRAGRRQPPWPPFLLLLWFPLPLPRILNSTSPKAEHGTDAVGRVGGQGFDGGEPPTRTDAGGGDPTMRTDATGGKRPQAPQSNNGSIIKKRKKHTTDSSHIPKVPRKSPNSGLRSPMQVTSSPGVNFLAKSAAVKREAVKRANMAGSPKTPQPPSCPELGSPSLDDLSPDTGATNSQAPKRKRRKLISDIWKEAEPIYKDGKLVEGIKVVVI